MALDQTYKVDMDKIEEMLKNIPDPGEYEREAYRFVREGEPWEKVVEHIPREVWLEEQRRTLVQEEINRMIEEEEASKHSDTEIIMIAIADLYGKLVERGVL